VRDSSSFNPEKNMRRSTPGWRPKSVRYSIHTRSIATKATASVSHRAGSGERLSVQ